jgi:hypothetical protein
MRHPSAVVDTGATRSIATTKALQTLYVQGLISEPQHALVAEDCKFRFANGETSASTHKISLTIKTGLASPPVVFHCHVIDAEHPLILLGADVLDKLQAVIRYRDGTATMELNAVQPNVSVRTTRAGNGHILLPLGQPLYH